MVPGMKLFDMARLTAFSLVVSACAGATIVTNVSYEKGGLRDTFFYVASDRDFLIELHGNPSGKPQAVFDESVIAAMQGSSFGPLTNFTTTPSANTSESYRLVVVFSGDRYSGATAICRDVDSASLKPVAGRVEIQAAFCYRDETLSQLNVAYPQGSPALGDAMSQVFINLFPHFDPASDDLRRDDQEIILFP